MGQADIRFIPYLYYAHAKKKKGGKAGLRDAVVEVQIRKLCDVRLEQCGFFLFGCGKEPLVVVAVGIEGTVVESVLDRFPVAEEL